MLEIDSTSSKERVFGDFLIGRLATAGCRVERFPLEKYGKFNLPEEDRPQNILFSWGVPEVMFCTHLDTVAPYIAPAVEVRRDGSSVVRGRGSCDAKGQIFAMYSACVELEKRGCTGFGLLLLAGEEAGSYGAKSFREVYPDGRYLVVGEPTGNRMVAASKGTKTFAVSVTGQSFHSGYPVAGAGAVDRFVDMMNELRGTNFPLDPCLGETTWNVGKLSSDNAHNVLSSRLDFRICFRTTFLTDEMVCRKMESLADEFVSVEALGGDTPSSYMTLPGMKTTVAAFGSDASHLTNFRYKMLYGPGSILTAHTAGEHVRMEEIEEAVQDYIRIYDLIMEKN